ncbi:N-acetyltransferase family protein [Dactylosporangium sp. CS-047395]|uniref:GNAT family N-acetyltransferase n=1 Tax=Dactylosporangium sp. CS-047395 TaxID=3239936 RepID=UPI003D93978F
MNLRLATVEDARALATLHVSTWQAAYRGLIPQRYLDALDVAERAREWRRRLAEPPPAAVVIVAEDPTGLHGFVTVDSGVVRALYVHPDHWSTGIGRRLMDAGLDHLRAAGCTEAELWVLATNERARRFYTAAGWHPDGTVQVEDFDGVPLEELRYRRTLA